MANVKRLGSITGKNRQKRRSRIIGKGSKKAGKVAELKRELDGPFRTGIISSERMDALIKSRKYTVEDFIDARIHPMWITLITSNLNIPKAKARVISHLRKGGKSERYIKKFVEDAFRTY